MRNVILALLLAASTSATGLALAMPPPPAHAAPAAHVPTPPNPDKVIRPTTPAVKTTPTVSYHTAVLAERHGQVAQDPSKPIPAKLRLAKQEVLERNQEVMQARVAFRTESSTIEGQTKTLAHPMETRYRDYQGQERVGTSTNHTTYEVEIPATPEALGKASEAYVSAAQLLVSRSGNLSQRVARENPDPGAKADAAKEIAVDYKKGAALYRLSATAEERRADVLTAQGKLPAAQIARDKAHNTRTVADRFDRKAAEVEASGVPGANAYTLPAEITLSAN